MMNRALYPEIFRRRSFHLFRNTGNERLTAEELRETEAAWNGFEKLYPGIRTALRIIPADRVNLKRDAEYCILIYSEKKENYLMNAGYLGEQLDLYLVSRNIGTLWYGIGKPDEPVYDGLDYVIMIAVRKIADAALFRKDMYKSKRKELNEIWSGDTLGIGETVRFAPSACNSQPWYVKNENGALTVFRYKKRSRIGIMSPAAASYFNRIDIGIFLCMLEICMAEKGISADRTLYPDTGDEAYTRVAEYRTA